MAKKHQRKKKASRHKDLDLPFVPTKKKLLDTERKRLEEGADTETLQELLTRFNITHWDYLIVGDGSGSTGDRECGWASVMIEKNGLARTVWFGAMNMGTVNVAEIMAYFQPLNHIFTSNDNLRGGKFVNVHVLTDSEYVANTGNSTLKRSHKNWILWNTFHTFQTQGLLITWHWVPRDTVSLNKYVDSLSKGARVTLKDFNKQVKETVSEDAALEFNPTT